MATKSKNLDLSLLPSLVFLKVIKLLSVNFNDVRNLSYTSKRIRDLVMENLHLLYETFLVLDNSVEYPENRELKKQVLSLKICTLEDRPFMKARLDPNDPPLGSFLSILLVDLDLSNLKCLELRNANPSRSRLGFLKIKQNLPRNRSLSCSRSLEYLKMDVHLINLSEIRNSIINVLYQHDDFATGGPITNIDYIVNSAVSQVLFNFLQFVDDLFSGTNENLYDPYGRCYLSELEINFIPEPDCDWKGPDLERENLNRAEVSQLRECLSFMINEFKRRIKLKAGVIKKITAFGIPNFFHNDVLELTRKALEESTFLWAAAMQKYSINDEVFKDHFNLCIEF